MTGRNKIIPWYLRGWAIVVGLLLFWPLGLALVVWRTKSDRSFHGAAGRALQIAGWILLVTCGAAIVRSILELPEAVDVPEALVVIVLRTLFAAGGIVLIWQGSRVRNAVARRRLLIAQIVNEQATSLDTIASVTGRPVGEVYYDVRLMLESGFLPGFVLDPDTRRIWRPLAPIVQSQLGAAPQGPAQFICSGCGARNVQSTAEGQPACAYCDLPLAVA